MVSPRSPSHLMTATVKKGDRPMGPEVGGCPRGRHGNGVRTEAPVWVPRVVPPKLDCVAGGGREPACSECGFEGSLCH